MQKKCPKCNNKDIKLNWKNYSRKIWIYRKLI